MLHTDDTIAAVASASGGALRGIVRLSGPNVVACLRQCFVPAPPATLDRIDRPTCVQGHFRHPARSLKLPCDVFLWPTKRSYTRQPAAEVHTVGSPPLLEMVLDRLCHHGARLAEPGEFTMRAFLAGRLDLTQAEAVLGVIDAAGAHELNTALAQLAGGLAHPFRRLREQLLDLLSQIEAGLDFVDEDIEFISGDEIDRQLNLAIDIVQRVVRQLHIRLDASPQRRAVFFGWPNVGKSSLINALCDASVAIVSDVAGTTRDYLSRTVDLDGLLVTLIDTAGVEDVDQRSHSPGSLAQRQASQQNRQAHLRMLCLDNTRPLNPWERRQVGQQDDLMQVVLTKCDQPAACDYDGPALSTSSTTLQGLASLRQEMRERLISSTSDQANILGTTGARCRDSIRLADESLQRARRVNAANLGDELIASELRLALDQLGKVVGAVYTDDILDRIFGRFCIGK